VVDPAGDAPLPEFGKGAEQEVKRPTIKLLNKKMLPRWEIVLVFFKNLRRDFMVLLVLEALLALLLLLGIVWWTMFSGRTNGELKSKKENQTQTETNDKHTT
jgi:cytoskeletal protein RodZ